ncbi:MAG TPA: hypothetical protein VNK89_10685 [Thermoflexus sp.]|nr:hypothetical protein [Thermoflexus sp.]
MSHFEILKQHRDALLLAEIAAWLHNLGKLDPNFLVMETGESPDILGVYRIPPSDSQISGQYNFRRFTQPTVLQSQSDLSKFMGMGVLYFPSPDSREEVQQIEKRIEDIQIQLKSASANKRVLGMQLERYKQEREQAREKRDRTERQTWERYEKAIEERCKLPELNWPLGSLLMMFWEDWFDKPQRGNYLPGSDQDPDYQREPKPDIQLAHGLSMDVPALLLLAHGEVSGQEKKGLDQSGKYVNVDSFQESNPAFNKLRMSTAFGYEIPLSWEKWQKQRREIIDKILTSWDNPMALYLGRSKLFQALARALGDTRRPINEISLWDYSASTAALFKTAIAQYFLTGQMPTPNTMRWRLVSVRCDAFNFLFQVSQLSDLLARFRMLKESQRLIRHALEAEIPVGFEVYADEHGSVFVFPELPGWEEKEIEAQLTALIANVLDHPEMLSTLPESDKPQLYGPADWRPLVRVGPPQRGKALNLQHVLPQEEPIGTLSPEQVAQWWSYATEERCVVCELRPVGYMEEGLPGFVTRKKAKERKVCGVCLAQRGRRAQEWATKRRDETIWIDEVADANAHLALIVGSFDLTKWLDGTLIRTLAIGTDDEGNWLVKQPTFARTRRVWETTHGFWKEIQEEISRTFRDDRRRLCIWLNQRPDLSDFHVYELDLDGTILSVAWCPDGQNGEGFLISTDNLGYTARQLGAEEEIYSNPAAAAIFVEDYIRKRFVDGEHELILRDPEASTAERRRNLLEGYQIIRTDHEDVAYTTAILILAEPRTFMALVPADKALSVIKTIKSKYETEMGKVRNRLPLTLGVVYAHRRTPLAAILDAGRRMLRRPTRTIQAKVQEVTPQNPLPDGWPSVQAVKLEIEEREIVIGVPTVMGDGTTPDVWYPYWQVAGKPTDRTRWFVGPDGEHWVHVCDLRPNDMVAFTPSTFDFEYLDASGRRFDVAYDNEGRRRNPTCRQRPYLLEEIDALEQIWNEIRRLSLSQIHMVRALIEDKRRAWGEPTGTLNVSPAFRQFVADVLCEAHIHSEALERAAITGLLADALEIHLTIHKERP